MTSTKFPEAEGRDLTDYQKQLNTDGFCIVPDVLPPQKAKEALDRLWKAAEESRRRGTDTYLPHLDPNESNTQPSKTAPHFTSRGSHKWQTIADVPPDAESKLIPFEAKAGSIICMEGRIWHTSGKNITKDQDRALMFGAYNAAFLRGQVNWAAGLSEETKKTLTPQMRDWLGVDANGNIGKVTGMNKVYYKG
ncbi:hypothetical protein N0V83_009288 [Neocucurbitaria cava]|uniref:Phytanoyl-CoA dioxygenase family protein n=1 Tax=Neocucurbitaria cava TaxID=798079 RepID=A0A9W8Y291_9PLEO|nr:hypothetical protein N0V83_009288 [Neocucurbitaria cava]